MNVRQAIAWGAQKLSTSAPRLDAEVLLMHQLGLSREQLYLNPGQLLTWWQLWRYKQLINQRRRQIPVAYLTGTKEFLGHTFIVNRDVLIPRPETETIVTSACQLAIQLDVDRLYDVGTGSGVIAVGLALALPNAKIIATDRSPRALAVARRNASKHQVANRVDYITTHLLPTNLPSGIVVANLPYLPDTLDLSPEVQHEPGLALRGGSDGLDLYRQLFAATSHPIYVIELGSLQYEPMRQWLADNYDFIDIQPILNIDGTICGLTARRV